MNMEKLNASLDLIEVKRALEKTLQTADDGINDVRNGIRELHDADKTRECPLGHLLMQLGETSTEINRLLNLLC